MGPKREEKGMKRIIFVIASSFVLISLCGCVSTMLCQQTASVVAPPKVEKASFDVSTPGSDAGQLFVQFRQPTYRMLVDKYAVKIDSNPPLVVPRQSDVDIKLNAGKHTLKFYAPSSVPGQVDKVAYGQPSKKDIVITKDQQLKLKYTGPFQVFNAGNVAEIK